MKNVIIITMGALLLWRLVCFCGGFRAEQAISVHPSQGRTIIIDAGHGGEDGGAVSLSGARESDINLAISCKLEDILALYGTVPEMVRRDDRSLHHPDADTLRQKKVSDLHNRVSFVEDTHEPLLLSIHQNSYPQQKYRGGQVFYADTSGSEEWAIHITDALRETLDSINTRQPKQIPDTVYLLNHIHCPAVLIECGFLSNPEEETLLQQDEYQRKLACCLAGAVLTGPEAIRDNWELRL